MSIATFRNRAFAALGVGMALVVAACGGSSAPASTPATQNDSSGSVSAVAAEFAPPDPSVKATLTIWSYLGVGTYTKVLADFEAEFKKQYPNVTFESLVKPFSDLRNTVLTAAASKDGPDILIYDPADTPVLATAGALADISAPWNAFADKGQWADPLIWKNNGSAYAVQAYVNTTAFYYNKDILKAAGVKAAPTTFDELGAALAKVSAAGYEGFALCAAPTNECETQAIAWILGQGGNYNNLDAPGVQKVLTTFGDWARKGYIPKDAATWSQGDANKEWLGGKVAFVQAGNWMLRSNQTDAKFDWGVVRLPGGKVAPGGEGEAVGAFSSNKALAWKFLTSTYWSKEGQLKILEAAGSIPARNDAAGSTEVKKDPFLPAWTAEIADLGARPPVVDGDIQKATTALGEVWSAVISGQKSAADGLAQLKQATQGLF